MTRNILKTTASALVLTLTLATSGALAQELPSREEMWQMIQKQQEQIQKLEAIVGVTAEKVAITEKKVAETAVKVEATGEAVDQVINTGGKSPQNATTVGGYAELHYNGGKADEVDLHRFVVFLGHEFNDKIRFFSELEVEHAVSEPGAPGAVEMEQAYIEMDLNNNNHIAIGQILVPVGIINETHEPPTFYGVERNNVEKNIIPATWWEAGVKFSGNVNESFSYDLMMHSGLDTTDEGYKIRSGRKQVAEAPWKNTAFTARASWHGIPGVQIGATFQYQTDITQSQGIDESASATLLEVHTNIERAVSENGTIGFRALFAQWNINADQAKAMGRDTQRGWYIEPSYKIKLADENAIGFFARYSVWDNEAGDAIDSAYKQTNFGINYWPHEHVVLKMDYQIDKFAKTSSEDNRINLGVGVYF